MTSEEKNALLEAISKVHDFVADQTQTLYDHSIQSQAKAWEAVFGVMEKDQVFLDMLEGRTGQQAAVDYITMLQNEVERLTEELFESHYQLHRIKEIAEEREKN